MTGVHEHQIGSGPVSATADPDDLERDQSWDADQRGETTLERLDRNWAVTAAHRLAIVGTGLLGTAVIGVVLLLFDVLCGRNVHRRRSCRDSHHRAVAGPAVGHPRRVEVTPGLTAVVRIDVSRGRSSRYLTRVLPDPPLPLPGNGLRPRLGQAGRIQLRGSGILLIQARETLIHRGLDLLLLSRSTALRYPSQRVSGVSPVRDRVLPLSWPSTSTANDNPKNLHTFPNPRRESQIGPILAFRLPQVASGCRHASSSPRRSTERGGFRRDPRSIRSALGQ